MCSAFLWTGPALKSTSAKVAWKEICSLKSEGGLGIRELKEVNKVYGLKLIWRFLSGDSLWGRWIRVNLLKGRNFWEVISKMKVGSWMWHKMLKLRDVAKLFFKKEVGNGRHTSFWYDNWSNKGVLSDLLGARGIIDLGVCKDATVKEAVNMRRRRRHRTGLLNEIEAELNITLSNLIPEREDASLWRGKSGYKKKISTQDTWLLLRESKAQCTWARGVWFTHATPKFAFMTWLSMCDSMSTLDRSAKWSQGLDPTCLLCKNATESRNHLFLSALILHKYRNILLRGYSGMIILMSEMRLWYC